MRISSRITFGLTCLFTLVGGISLYWVEHSIQNISRTFQHEALRKQASILIQHMVVSPSGTVVLHLPESIAHTYGQTDHGKIYLIAEKSGTILASSTPEAKNLLAEGLLHLKDLATFSTLEDDSGSHVLYGMVRRIPEEKAAGKPLYVIVARYQGGEEVILSRATDKITLTLLYILLPIYGLALFFAIITIVIGLRPLNILAQEAKKILPHDLNIRLDETLAPEEVKPFVNAINRLLSRLELNFTERQHFLTDSAHQLRTPLAVMRARLDQLADFPGKADLERDITHLSRLIRQLLTLAQIEGKSLKLTPTDLTAIARERAEQLAPLAMSMGTSFKFTAPEEPVYVELNPSAAGEAIGNILDNAIRFSPQGKAVKITINANGQLQVHDRGPGVAPDKRANLFKRTWQDTGREDGVGLGLAIVGEIMRKHLGTASVTDREGGGSTLTLQFNLAKPPLALPHKT